MTPEQRERMERMLPDADGWRWTPFEPDERNCCIAWRLIFCNGSSEPDVRYDPPQVRAVRVMSTDTRYIESHAAIAEERAYHGRLEQAFAWLGAELAIREGRAEQEDDTCDDDQ